MKQSSIYGTALIVGALGAVVTMIFHPTGHDLLGPADEVARRNEMITVAVHSLVLVSIPILFFGLLGFSRRLGVDRALVSAALIAYGFGAVFAMCAAIINGLVGPVLTREILETDESGKQVLHTILWNNGMIGQAFFVIATSLAVAFWSISILKMSRFARAIGIIGCVIGALSLVAFLAGHLRLNVHGLGLFVFAQSIWMILVGVFMYRASDTEPGAVATGS